MNKIKLEIEKTEEQGVQCLSVLVEKDSWKGFNTSYLISEVFECFLHASVKKIRFDFTAVNCMNSTCLGSMANLVYMAQENKKELILKVDSDLTELINQSGIKDLVQIETVSGN